MWSIKVFGVSGGDGVTPAASHPHTYIHFFHKSRETNLREACGTGYSATKGFCTYCVAFFLCYLWLLVFTKGNCLGRRKGKERNIRPRVLMDLGMGNNPDFVFGV